MSIADWTTDARKAFGLYVTLNSLFGLWPLVRVDLRLKIRMAMAVVEMIFMMANTLYEMIKNCGDAEDSLDNLLLMASGGINLSKLIIYHVNREKLTVNVASAIRDWSSIETADRRRVMSRYERFYKRISYVLVTAVIWCGGLYLLKVLVIDPDETSATGSAEGLETNVTRLFTKKRYIFPSECTPSNVSGNLHLALVLNQLVQLTTICVIAVGSDAFFLAIATHLCGQFEILRIEFAAVGGDSRLPTATTSRDKMAALISRHQHLLALAELLEGSYNKIVLVQLMTSIILINVAGFSFVIAMKTGDFIGSVKSFVVIQYVLLQSFMYSCIGEALQSRGDDITRSVYSGSWYDLPRSLSKDLVFVMMRSNVSPRLTAGKFFHMTRATFMSVVKLSASYLSALQMMLDE